jgi:hypothetical protein
MFYITKKNWAGEVVAEVFFFGVFLVKTHQCGIEKLTLYINIIKHTSTVI